MTSCVLFAESVTVKTKFVVPELPSFLETSPTVIAGGGLAVIVTAVELLDALLLSVTVRTAWYVPAVL